jgi:hypothetical protein
MSTTKTLDTELAKLHSDYEKKRQKLQQEWDIKLELGNKLGGGVLNKLGTIHIYELYGTHASLHFGDRYGTSNDKKIDIKELEELGRAFPPLPLVRAKGTFLTFGLAKFFENNEDASEKYPDLLDISPYVVEIESDIANIWWLTKLNNFVVKV